MLLIHVVFACVGLDGRNLHIYNLHVERVAGMQRKILSYILTNSNSCNPLLIL